MDGGVVAKVLRYRLPLAAGTDLEKEAVQHLAERESRLTSV
jgi:hypothetical protein